MTKGGVLRDEEKDSDKTSNRIDNIMFITGMTTFIKAKLKISEVQKNIHRY